MRDLNGFIKDSELWFQNIMESIRKYAFKLEESEKWFSTVLRSIGDAVIVTDESGFIQFMNPIAETLTEWDIDNAYNKPLEDVFYIINEESGKIVENPVRKVMREKVIIGLANHTILITKNGKEIPIDDSGAPIEDNEGKIIGIVLIFRDISQRRHTEKLIELSELKHRSLFEQASIGVFIHDLDGNILDANKMMQNLLGYTKEEITKLKCYEMHPPDTKTPKLGKENFEQILQKGSTHFKTLFMKKDGCIFHGDVFSNIITYEDVKLIQGTIQDITQRKKDKQKIEHINTILKAIRNVNQIIIRETDRKVLIEKICENLTKTRGFLSAWVILLDSKNKYLISAESGVGNIFSQLVDLFKQGHFSRCFNLALNEEGVSIIEEPEFFCVDCPISSLYEKNTVLSVKLSHSDSNYGVLVVSIPKHLSNSTEEQDLMREVANDIAFALNKIELEEEKNRSEVRYEELYESMMDAYVYVDMEGNIIEYNQQYLDMLGYSKNEVANLKYSDITPKKWHEFENEIVNKQILINGYSEVYEKEYIKKDGTIFPVELRTFLLKDKKDRAKGMWAIVRDISQRKENEIKLMNTQHILRERFKEISCLYYLSDLGASLNKSLEEIFQESLNLFKAAWQFPEITHIKITFNGNSYQTENFKDTPWKLLASKVVDNRDLTIEVIYTENKPFLKEEHDLIEEIAKRLVSIIKHREYEQKLITSEEKYREAYNRAEFYKDLFAHDIKNILQSILSGLELNQYILKNQDDKDLVNQNVKVIKDQILRGVKLVSNVRKISQLEDKIHSTISIEVYKPIKNAINSLKLVDFNREIRTDIQITDKNLKVLADDFLPDIFEIILTNSVRHNENQVIEIIVNISRQKNEDINYVRIEFIDNGVGIIDSRKLDIFLRGYSENKSIHGMGLGLSLVARIMKNYNGKIWVEDRVENNPSRGSKFIILIPEG
ncbi:MAG: PAS domain S-box protein [Candidatus Lokiarchaeota archaeon]|nr:PAS domain S-box protein [Candidatus Lokiarchaeota archaeon]